MKRFAASIFALLVAVSLSALEVDRKEIDPGADGKTIEFVNYTGPHAVIDSIKDIEAIGTALGTSIVSVGSAGDKNRYYVIHAVDPATKEGFDADILMLGPAVGVDHIDNLRRIISAYLSAAYGYSAKDSSTLATFITVYNAVYRGKLDVFKARYKTAVTGNLSAEKVGLSVRYDEWAGRSEIVIPLSDPRLTGTISTIDTTTLTDKNVVSKIKQDENNSTDTRKAMVDLKERETASAQTRAETAQTEAAKERTDLATKQTEAAKAQQDATVAVKAAENADKAAKAAPEDKALQQKAADTKKEAEVKTAQAEQKQAAADKVSDSVAKKEESAKADQTLADAKQKEAQTERKEIAADTQQAVNDKNAKAAATQQDALATALPAFMLKIVDEKSLLSELLIVNLNDGKTLKASPVNSIRGRTFIDTGSGLVAIAGKKGGNAAIRLVLIDSTTLEIAKQGTDSIAESSVLVKNGNDFYAVIEQASGKCVIGRFDGNMETKAKSAITVSPVTAIVASDKGLIVQDGSGAIKLLRPTDLTDQSE
jgi:hypothetical protein